MHIIQRSEINIYRKSADEVEVLKSGDQTTTGDLLQIAYVAAGKTYGVILSLKYCL